MEIVRISKYLVWGSIVLLNLGYRREGIGSYAFLWLLGG